MATQYSEYAVISQTCLQCPKQFLQPCGHGHVNTFLVCKWHSVMCTKCDSILCTSCGSVCQTCKKAKCSFYQSQCAVCQYYFCDGCLKDCKSCIQAGEFPEELFCGSCSDFHAQYCKNRRDDTDSMVISPSLSISSKQNVNSKLPPKKRKRENEFSLSKKSKHN